jgi:hypothetical protein
VPAGEIVSAQTPHAAAADPAAPPKIFTRRSVLHLPITLDARSRAEVREVYLYVKYGSGDWVRNQTAPADQTLFTFTAPQDGEYWFHVVTLSKSGELTPADLNREPPGLIIVVDTQPPQADVRALPAPPGEALFHCEIRDANPDYGALRLYYETPDSTWRMMDVVPDRPGYFRAAGVQVAPRKVRVEAADRAGNALSREVAVEAAAPASPIIVVQGTDQPLPSAEPAVGPKAPERAGTPPERTTTPPELTPVPPAADKAALPEPPAVQRVSERQVSAQAESTPNGAGVLFVNKTKVLLNYAVEGASPSGVGRVEVWITRDMGQNWQKLCEDPRGRAPVEVNLPGEGLYGVAFVVTTGSGIGGSPPARGDRPAGWVEVDLTKPEARLVSTTSVAGSESGAVLITWNASDRNLGQTPVDLYYAAQHEGPWLPIARGVKNDGTYCWVVPGNVGPRILVRMDVTDQAGNLTRCETPSPVVIDRAQLKARLVGISAGAPQPQPPSP